MAIGSIIGGGIGLLGQLAGSDTASKAEEEAQRLRQYALQQLMGINVPDPEFMQRDYIVPEVVGEYTPEMEDFIELGPTAMEDIEIDPRLRQAQFQALEQMSELGETGLTPADIAALEQVRRGTEGQAQARQEAILQQMQSRGQGGSGAELIAKLQSGQAAADRASSQGLDIAQIAQQRALQAMMNAGELGGSIRGQEFGEQSNIAQSKDLINKFNIANQQGLQQRNVGQQNIAQQQNLARRQAQEQERARLRNLEQDIKKDAYQQQFQNLLAKNRAAAGQQGNLARGAERIGQRRGQTQTDIAGSIGDMFAGAGGMLESGE